MQIQRTCKQCGTPLGSDKKLGALYCNHSCSQGYFKRREIIRKRIKKLNQSLEFNRNWITENKAKVADLDREISDLSEMKQTLASLKKRLSTLKLLLKSSVQVFQKSLGEYLDRNMDKFGDDYDLFKYGTEYEQEEVLLKHHRRFISMKKRTKDEINTLKKELKDCKKANQKTEAEQLMLSLKNFQIKAEIETLEKELSDLTGIDLENLPPRPNPKKQDQNNPKLKQLAKGVSGNEILNMKFNNLELSGALGQFLGLLQRNKCAIALTGNSGAGKTTFSFQLAKSFINANQSVGYFSLESGITETTQTIIEDLNLTAKKFEVFEEGDLNDVRLQAGYFDCIIVDSYAKISTKAEDFEALRQDFPNTFFIIIFQKTTDGKIRGGSSILYNSTATIDIRLTKGNHRIAFMQKSRYGTENFVYSISLDTVLKDQKPPISWAEIEQNWPSPHRH